MKAIPTLLCFTAVTAVMVYGCRYFYKDTETIEAMDISAETDLIPEEETPEEIAEDDTAEELYQKIPCSDMEISLSEGKSISFTFLGDCLLASNEGDTRHDCFTNVAESTDHSYFFEKALPCYSDSDFVIANNEFVFSDRELTKSRKDGEAYWFKSPTSYTDILTKGGIDIVSVANNHTLDYGFEGYYDTWDALDAAGITWGDLDHPIYVTKDDVTFGIICTGLFDKKYDPLIIPVIEEVKENSDIQILFFHGGTEKKHIPDEWLVDYCHKYVDMGVDLIVGCHPHVLRPMETYNGVNIVYSIGNFCYGGNRLPENRTVVFTQTFNFDQYGVYRSYDEEFIPFYVYGGNHNNWQPVPVTDPVEISKTLSFMYSGTGYVNDQ